MAVQWTPHRFSGGVLALDVANTVVLRNEPERTFDRFAESSEIGRFAVAANRFRAREMSGRTIVAGSAGSHDRVVALRETIDRLFRDTAGQGVLGTAHLPAMLDACSLGLKGQSHPLDAQTLSLAAGAGEIALEAALSLSALSLLTPGRLTRVRICANCAWLFLDTSRNGSRIWCDMAVCGNRQKARRHYRRRRAASTEDRHVWE